MGIKHLQPIASALLVMMALLSFVHVLLPAFPAWGGGVAAWLALLLILLHHPWRQFGQFFALAGIGALLLLWSRWQGQAFHLTDLLQQNISLLVMLFSVSFLRLVAVPEQVARQPLPVGRMAFFKTLLGVHILGAVINLSIIVLMMGRYQDKQALGRNTVSLLGQGFAAAALWSPFFAAMGVALTHAPGASLYAVVAYGLGLNVLALGLITLLAGGWRLQRLDNFPGYPMQTSSLLVPVTLAVLVLVLHGLLPGITVLALVSITSILLTLCMLALGQRPQGWQPLYQHLLSSAGRMSRELALFLGAGLLALGLQAVLLQVGALPWLQQFNGLTVALLLALAILVSLIGVHPVISISVLGPVLLPLQPDHNLLAVLFLVIWSLGVVASPFSGMNVMLRSQFPLSGSDLFKWNIGYVLIMWVLISVVFLLLLA
ncbi:MAG: hypothetical protein R3E95_00595 [Thiolinea sp.]